MTYEHARSWQLPTPSMTTVHLHTQATASALYELLAVRGLEEVVPAVRTLLARAS